MTENRFIAAAAGVAANHATNMRKLNFFFSAISLLLLAVAIPSAQAQTFTALHQFDSQTDGAFPQGPVLRDAAGNLSEVPLAGWDSMDVFSITGNPKF